jgi:hypothetical protein
MMHIGLIGSTSFYHLYKNEFSKHPQVAISLECSLLDALNNTSNFEKILFQCEYIFFEEMNAPYFNLITSCLKNGKHIIIDSLSITSEQIHEIYSIAIEGNLTCLILNDPSYYQLFKPFSKEINNPFYIEMEVQNNNESEKDLPTHIPLTIYQCMQHVLYLFKSDIKQINVKSCKIFSEKIDFISVMLDFSNGCCVHLKITTLNTPPKHTIHVYQQDRIYTLDLIEKTICKNDNTNNQNNQIVTHINTTSEKLQHFLEVVNHTKTYTHSLLDRSFALELSGKILKKINSFNE